MGKKEKTGTSSVKKDELLTINQKKVKVNLPPEESSIFSNIGQAPGIEKTIHVNKTKTISGIEENNIVVQDDVQIDIVKPIVQAPETIVYELTYMEENQEKVIYTKDLPSFSEKYLLNVGNAFGRSNLKEIVLGRKEIKTSCNNPLSNTELIIDMRGGLLIKVVPEQEWMNRGYDETKKLFDETVLKAYRDLAVQGITAPAATQPVKQNAQRRQAPLPAPDNENNFPVGNIPVGRAPIISDL